MFCIWVSENVRGVEAQLDLRDQTGLLLSRSSEVGCFKNQIFWSRQRFNVYITINNRITHAGTLNLSESLSAVRRERNGEHFSPLAAKRINLSNWVNFIYQTVMPLLLQPQILKALLLAESHTPHRAGPGVVTDLHS